MICQSKLDIKKKKQKTDLIKGVEIVLRNRHGERTVTVKTAQKDD